MCIEMMWSWRSNDVINRYVGRRWLLLLQTKSQTRILVKCICFIFISLMTLRYHPQPDFHGGPQHTLLYWHLHSENTLLHRTQCCKVMSELNVALICPCFHCSTNPNFPVQILCEIKQAAIRVEWRCRLCWEVWHHKPSSPTFRRYLGGHVWTSNLWRRNEKVIVEDWIQCQPVLLLCRGWSCRNPCLKVISTTAVGRR